METAMTFTALERMLDPLSRCLDKETARRIVESEIDPALQVRLDELAERVNEGSLTDEERSEYQSYVDAADLIAVFKAKARHILNTPCAAE
jgi:hypothetical protein